MSLRKLLSLALVAASVMFASTASAKTVAVVWTCNSDGFMHVVITRDDGSTSEWITRECGPGIALGRGFNLVLAERTRSMSGGQAFLKGLEAGGALTARRAPAVRGETARRPSGSLETIQLSRADVGPHLASLLTAIAPDWRGSEQASTKMFSIFDRWGNLITARGDPALVPGDAGMNIPAKGGAAGERRNAKQRCLDKHGIWREKPKGEWGCWTSAK